jgi:hypothetical protein
MKAKYLIGRQSLVTVLNSHYCVTIHKYLYTCTHTSFIKFMDTDLA